MVIGITLFGVLTVGVAAYFVHDPNRNTQDEQAAKILARFDALKTAARLAGVTPR
jgi:hypothetical protein